MQSRSGTDVDAAEPLAVVSGDSHIGPRLEDMREFCPADLLDEYDDYVKSVRAFGPMFQEAALGDSPEAQVRKEQFARNRLTTGHHDITQRLKEMDADGIASEIIFHGSQNGEPVPFVAGVGFSFDHTQDLERAWAGLDIYNHWLAAACSVAPQRLLGAVHLPQWDIDQCVEVVRWARDAGLRVANFSAPRPGITPYDAPEWEPFWSACEELGMALATHAGALDLASIFGTLGPHMVPMVEIEAGGWLARRALHRLVFSGVFERHPGLVFMVTEQNGEWWSATMREYDSSYLNHRFLLKDTLPRMPSEYCSQSVYIGASFMAPFEAEMAVHEGYTANVIWGRDYPHVEGTWQYQDDRAEEENMTRLSLRHTFSDIPAGATRAMLQDNGIKALGLDGAELHRIADRIGAPTLAELAEPIDAVPEPGHGGVLAFRTVGPWH
jgi:predicted TIM-barrel fold metal-dependent hydrolase